MNHQLQNALFKLIDAEIHHVDANTITLQGMVPMMEEERHTAYMMAYECLPCIVNVAQAKPFVPVVNGKKLDEQTFFVDDDKICFVFSSVPKDVMFLSVTFHAQVLTPEVYQLLKSQQQEAEASMDLAMQELKQLRKKYIDEDLPLQIENDASKKNASYQYQALHIPDEWIAIQKEQPILTVYVKQPSKEERPLLDDLKKALNAQTYKKWEVLEINHITDLHKAYGTYLTWMDIEDRPAPEYFASVVECINEHQHPHLVICDYDILVDDAPLIAVRRNEDALHIEASDMMQTAVFFERALLENVMNEEHFLQALQNVPKEHIAHESRIQYHYQSKTARQKNTKQIRPIAFYLTQYHETEENNRWWGKGFTEWQNVKLGIPLYKDHDQPRVPTELGYYDLVEEKDMLKRQIDLAKEYGVHGFCYYYYWFEGKRLLRKPLDQFLENQALDIPFCICWANEPWTRRWDGGNREVLMPQVHNERTDQEFILDMLPLFADSRYIKVDGKPLLLIYRIDLFEHPYRTIARWREICRREGIGDIFIGIVDFYDMERLDFYGADALVSFPPHGFFDEPITEQIKGLDPAFSGRIFSYRKMVESHNEICIRKDATIPGSMLRWDNTARRLTAADIMAEFTPELFKRWFVRDYYEARIYGKDVVFVNAWNEWAEGSYLEPDETYGRTFLEIMKEVLQYK